MSCRSIAGRSQLCRKHQATAGRGSPAAAHPTSGLPAAAGAQQATGARPVAARPHWTRCGYRPARPATARTARHRCDATGFPPAGTARRRPPPATPTVRPAPHPPPPCLRGNGRH
ncbi:hypothetical protein G6F61_014162 [Rhizopus arrhizus]|nr:hypothetical protein G6F61_014162 [Rhizopus arrhizus]